MAAVASGLALGVCAPARAEARVVPCPDPTMLIGRVVTLMCTGYGLPTRSAISIRGLRRARPHPAFAADGWPSWAGRGFWAPDLRHIGDLYVMYFSAKRRRDGRRCIGVAVSRRPGGGFRDLGRPLIADEPDGAIDPALLGADGKLLLIYKRDGNSVGAPSIILARQLSTDGLQVSGPRVKLLRSRPRGWEQGVVEGPSAIQLGGKTFLFYSGGYFRGPGYAEGEATRAGDPLGPFRRVSAAPLLHAYGRWVGIGGGSIVIDGHRLLLAYNAFPTGVLPVRRLLFIRALRLERAILRPVGPARQIPLRGAPS